MKFLLRPVVLCPECGSALMYKQGVSEEVIFHQVASVYLRGILDDKYLDCSLAGKSFEAPVVELKQLAKAGGGK